MLKKLVSALGFVVILIAMAISGQIGKEVGRFAFTPKKPNQQDIDAELFQQMKEAARQLNKNTPMMVDSNTRMDSATVGPGLRITYHYTFPAFSSRDLKPSLLRSNLQPTVRQNVCKNSDMKLSLEYGATYRYSYSGNDGAHIYTFELNGNDCGFGTPQSHNSDFNSSVPPRSSYSAPSQSSSRLTAGTVYRPPGLPQQTTSHTSSERQSLNDDYNLTIEIQRLLRELGFNPGLPDGIYGPQTHRAIVTAEKKLGMSHRGNITTELRDRLATEARKGNSYSQSSYGRPSKTSSCQFKPVMTDQDYINCGANPPSSYEYVYE